MTKKVIIIRKGLFYCIDLLLIQLIVLYFDMFLIDLHKSNKAQVNHSVLFDFVDTQHSISDIDYLN